MSVYGKSLYECPPVGTRISLYQKGQILLRHTHIFTEGSDIFSVIFSKQYQINSYGNQ